MHSDAQPSATRCKSCGSTLPATLSSNTSRAQRCPSCGSLLPPPPSSVPETIPPEALRLEEQGLRRPPRKRLPSVNDPDLPALKSIVDLPARRSQPEIDLPFDGLRTPSSSAEVSQDEGEEEILSLPPPEMLDSGEEKAADEGAMLPSPGKAGKEGEALVTAPNLPAPARSGALKLALLILILVLVSLALFLALR